MLFCENISKIHLFCTTIFSISIIIIGKTWRMDSALLSFLSQNVTTFVTGPNVSFRCAPNVLRTFFLVLRLNNPTIQDSQYCIAKKRKKQSNEIKNWMKTVETECAGPVQLFDKMCSNANFGPARFFAWPLNLKL